jgi:phytoene dehydrogenase-like protein
MSTARLDAVVIGAGVNGLVAARYLARSGRRVLVVEPGKDADQSAETGWVPPQLVRELGLGAQLRIEQPDPWITAPLQNGGRLELWRDPAKSAEAIGRISPSDGQKWPEFCARMRRLASVLEALYVQPPPDVETREVGELLRLAGLGLRVRRLGKQAIVDLLRVLPMSIAELLDDWFESDALKGVLGALGVWHLKQGPRGGGTAFNFLHHHVGCPLGVFRPQRSNVKQVLLAMPGVEVRQGSAVMLVRGGRASGVALGPTGDAIEAPLVVSGADPRATFEPLARELDAEFIRAIRNIKGRGVVARGTLRPNHPPDFSALCVAPSLEYLERAYDDAKYGRNSGHPYVEARAVDGRLELHVQYALAADRTLPERVAAALGGPAQAAQVTLETPEHLYHGDLTLDQILFMRPVPGWSRYRTPVEGLYLCGPGTHPGGGIAGAAGRNAARVILKDAKGS